MTQGQLTAGMPIAVNVIEHARRIIAIRVSYFSFALAHVMASRCSPNFLREHMCTWNVYLLKVEQLATIFFIVQGIQSRAAYLHAPLAGALELAWLGCMSSLPHILLVPS